jgi:hypothetical protein
VRVFGTFALASALLLLPAASRAEAPDPGAAIVIGASVFIIGFTAGGLLVATANARNEQDNAGWLTMQSGFALAPLAAHAAVGEGWRGLAFSAPPVAAIGCTEALFQHDPGTLLHGSLPEQRILWAAFTFGLLSGTAGLVDAGFAAARAAKVALLPVVGPGHVGLALGGVL